MNIVQAQWRTRIGMAGVDPNADMAFDDRLGECYQNAFQYALHNEGSTLIHGSIQGHGNPRIGHAWVVDADGAVFEPTMGKHWDSEKLFNAYHKAEIYHRYEKTEFATQALLTKHYGPWHETAGHGGLPVAASRENSTPTRVRARDWINNALRDGRIEKPPHCQGRDCKNTDTKAHHEDYRQKDKIKWYCSDCHEKADTKHGAYTGPVMYHGSPARNRASIQEHGLLMKHDMGEGYTWPGIYLSPRASASEWEDVWEVDVRGLRVRDDDPMQMQEFQDVGGSYYVEEDIPPGRLKLYRPATKHYAAKKPEWVKLTKPVRCRTVADHPQWHGPPDEYETYNDRPQIKVDTEGQVVAWLQGEMVPNGYNKIPDTYGYGMGPKVKTSDLFLVQFPNTPGLVILSEDQIELLDPIPRRKASVTPRMRVLLRDGTQPEIVEAVENNGETFFVDTLGKRHPASDVLSYREIKTAGFTPAAMHVYWDDPETGEKVQHDYCLDHGFEVLADKRAVPYYKNVGFFYHEAEISPGSLCIVCADPRNQSI